MPTDAASASAALLVVSCVACVIGTTPECCAVSESSAVTEGSADSASPRSEHGIHRERARPREHEADHRSEHCQRILVASRQEKTAGEVDQQDRPEHFEGETERGEPCEQPDDERQTAKEFEQRDERAHQAGHRYPHLGERAGHAGESVDEYLLGAMYCEHHTRDDA